MHNGARPQAFIPCKASRGMFSHERGARIELPDGKFISTFVDRSQVEVSREPAPEEEVDGMLCVSVVRVDEGSIVIDLPRPTFTTGTRLILPKGFVRTAA